jgi:hypothetical protein
MRRDLMSNEQAVIIELNPTQRQSYYNALCKMAREAEETLPSWQAEQLVKILDDARHKILEQCEEVNG